MPGGRAAHRRLDLTGALDAGEAEARGQVRPCDHFEFYWFPYGRKALVKRNNRLSPSGSAAAAGAARPLPGWRRFWEFEVMENAAFGTLCRIGRARPRLIPGLNRFSSAALSSRSYTDLSHRVFATPALPPV